MNNDVTLPHLLLVCFWTGSAMIMLKTRERSWGRRVVKSRLPGMCDRGRCHTRSEVSSSQFCSAVRSPGVRTCVNGLVAIVLKEQSTFVCKVWGVEQSSWTSQPLMMLYRSTKLSINSNPLTLSHLSWICSVHLFYIFARVNAYLYWEATCGLISCMLCHVPYIQT